MTAPKSQSPRIKSIGWGKIEIESLGTGKDFKLWPGGGRGWDWGETGTAHSPGIQVTDVEELVEHSCDVIVLGRGVFSRLKVADETTDYLQSLNIEIVATDTKRAVQIYNDYIDQKVGVGGLFHSTC